MYPENTTLVFSNFTPRNTKYMPKEAQDIIIFGTQYTLEWISDIFLQEFFVRNKEEVISEIKKMLDSYTGTDYDVTHFEALHDLGYLPICVRALEEGIVGKAQIPTLVYWNTLPEFFWITNFLETLISTVSWKAMHSASMAFGFRKILEQYCKETDISNLGFVDFQGHDFSMRGMQSPESALASGLGFATSFLGSDTLPVLHGAEYYYSTPNAVFSVPASEHAVATAYGKENEEEGFSRILELFPEGVVSLVSDSYDFWKIHTETIYKLKNQIMSRKGKTVFRGDSGNPADIICGTGLLETDHKGQPDFDWANSHTQVLTPSEKGQIELLWDCFGGTINDQGYKVLDSHVGAIWGDAINFSNMQDICERLKKKGFASTNIVFGVGSYSLGYATRDNQGTACKATYIEKSDGSHIEIFKDPITDPGKKSAKGLLAVFRDEDEELILKDQATWEDVLSENNMLKEIYNGISGFTKVTTLTEIREKIKKLL
jgi:nicotinamide phosphoribosyltransferase